MDFIRIRGARTHNLRNVDLDIPRDRLIVITGVSGSGKSSLAFNTIFAEGQRRYVESLSTYARQFLSRMEKPDLDLIEGLSPAISIEQKSTSHNPRSTVGTITEIYDYLRLLYARAGIPHCPRHGAPLSGWSVSQMVDAVLELPEETRCLLLAPLIQGRRGEHEQVFERLRREGFIRARVDGRVLELEETPTLEKNRRHDIEAIVDRFRVRPEIRQRIAESFETALQLSGGSACISPLGKEIDDGAAPGKELLFSANFACAQCGYSISELQPKLFSFNNPAGACADCGGLGVVRFFDPEKLIQDPELSLSGGALRGWGRSNMYCHQILEGLATHYDFDLDTPFRQLPEATRKRILYGSAGESIRFRFHGWRGARARRRPFEGVLPNLERRYRESASSDIREELARYQSIRPCSGCAGDRLNEAARHVLVGDRSLPQIARLPVEEALAWFRKLRLAGRRGAIARRIVKEVQSRLRFLVDVGLNYLSLERSAESLSGGEAQRIRLAGQIGAGLVGVMYVLDEPSIGLHQRDNRRLLDTLLHLRNLGNTVLVVEHDEEAIRHAEHVIDIGPGAGIHGGRIIAQGPPEKIARSRKSLTGRYLSGRLCIPVPKKRVKPRPGHSLRLLGASGNNLRDLDLELPLGLMICVTGVSGSGKSTLINDTLYRAAARELHNAESMAAPHRELQGLEQLDKVVAIDQSPIGRTPRSNPATYTGLFTPVRELFAGVPEARARGYRPGRFSFNVAGGRCETCHGDGLIRVEMHFLPDIYVPCDLCQGRRYNRETLEIRYKGKNIHEVLKMTVEEALQHYSAVPAAYRKLKTLEQVGLGYIHLGQTATTLSGGEAQRIRLARELSRREGGKTLYILDEPTTGLHFHDVRVLLRVLCELRDRGNTVVIIEHNLDVIKTADWIIDLGPEGGDGGGRLLAAGPPETLMKHPNSHTARFLRPLLTRQRAERASA